MRPTAQRPREPALTPPLPCLPLPDVPRLTRAALNCFSNACPCGPGPGNAPAQACTLLMQYDGNLVAYGNGVIWASNTNNQGAAPRRVTLSSACRVAVLDNNGAVLWSKP